VKYTSGIAATASGSIGGATASHNRGGQYFRRRAIPVNPSSTAQQAVRGFFSTLNAAWNSILTSAQRSAWDSYALNTPVTDALGNPVNAGGKGMYIRGNVPRLQGSLARVDAGPTTFGLPALTAPGVTSLVASTGVLTYTFTNTDTWAAAATGGLLIYVSRPQSVSINGFKGPFRFAGIKLGNATPPTSPGTVTSPFTYAVGQKGFIRFVAVTTDGRLSGEYIFPVTAS
jgi:hypothetical protein